MSLAPFRAVIGRMVRRIQIRNLRKMARKANRRLIVVGEIFFEIRRSCGKGSDSHSERGLTMDKTPLRLDFQSILFRRNPSCPSLPHQPHSSTTQDARRKTQDDRPLKHMKSWPGTGSPFLDWNASPETKLSSLQIISSIPP
jgi:hypothetical protein